MLFVVQVDGEISVPNSFVTGVSGFVGGAVAKELLRAGWTVRGLVRARADQRNVEAIQRLSAHPETSEFERWEGDLLDPPSLYRAMAGCDAVFHVAARYSLWNPRPREIYRDNVEGTRNVLEAARRAGVDKVVYTSTVGTLLPQPNGAPANESNVAALKDLRGHYKRSKWLAEREAREFARGGLPVTIVHPSAPVGPFDVKPTPTGQMIVDFLNGRAKAYTDTGLNIVAVEDVARGHLLALERGRLGESYLLGSENLSLRDIFRILAECSDVTAPRFRIPAPALVPISLVSELISRVTTRPPLVAWEAVAMSFKRMYFDTVKAREELGYEPGRARQALERAVLWFYENDYVTRPVDEQVIGRLRECYPKSNETPDAPP